MVSSKRRDTRYAIRVPVQLAYGNRVRSMLTEEVSYRGCFLRTDTPPRLRQLVQLKLVLPPGDRAIQVHGIVVHFVEPLNPADRTPGIGIQFYALDQETRGAWEEFIRYVEKRFSLAVDQSPLTLPDGSSEPIRRRYARYTAVLRVSVQTVDELFDLFARDVSKGGMFIETSTELAVGQPVIINVHHPERDDTLLLDAVVRRVQRRPTPGVGVEFVRMDKERREEFMEFVRGGIVVDDEPRIVDPDDPQLA
jgi:type IV pilus assembly protein PilZ